MFKKPSKLPGLPIKLPDPRPGPIPQKRPVTDGNIDRGKSPSMPRRIIRVPFDRDKKRR
jgi:hypothetical protein